jgi:hypothetical protein
VPALTPAKGEEEVDTGQVGAFGLYLVLAQRIDQKRSLTVATRWGGDTYLEYRVGGRTCVRTSFVGRDSPALNGIHGALDDWAAAGPAGSASVKEVGGAVLLESCDDGAGGVVNGPTVDALLGLPTARAQVAESVLKGGADSRFARCFSEGVVGLLTVDQLSASELDPASTARLQSLATTCRTS